MEKLNCWEFKQCGREPGGIYVHDLGICPAATEERLDGVHDGINAGRACWVVAGTMCRGEIQGTFAQKISDCAQCEFYDYVKSGEDDDFMLTINILKKIE